MRWKITGADASSGKEMVVELDAPTMDEATALAQYRNIFVETVSEVTPPISTAPVLDYRGPQPEVVIPPVASPKSKPLDAAEQAKIEARMRPSPFSRRTFRSRVGIFFLSLFAALFYLAGFASLFGGCLETRLQYSIFDGTNAFGATANSLNRIEDAFALVKGIGLILIGCLFHAIQHIVELRFDLKDVYENCRPLLGSRLGGHDE